MQSFLTICHKWVIPVSRHWFPQGHQAGLRWLEPWAGLLVASHSCVCYPVGCANGIMLSVLCEKMEKHSLGDSCLDGPAQWWQSDGASLDSSLVSWGAWHGRKDAGLHIRRLEFLLASCVISPSLDLIFLIYSVGRSLRSPLHSCQSYSLTIHAGFSTLSTMLGARCQRTATGGKYFLVVFGVWVH